MPGRLTSVALGVAMVALSLVSVVGATHGDDGGPTSVSVNPLNHDPLAQAGPAPMVIDGGSLDEDGEADGKAEFFLHGGRSSDPDDGTINEMPCEPSLSTTWPQYTWYGGSHEAGEQPEASGEYPLVSLAPGVHRLTLVVEDDCEATDQDPVRAFVGSVKQTVSKRTFDGVEAGLEAPWTRTDACGLDDDGSRPYLAFTRVTDDGCQYRTSERTVANATLSFGVPSADALGVSFDTQWDTRDGLTETPEDLLRAQVSLDGGESWTAANQTFAYERGDEERIDGWVEAAGVFDLRERSVSPGDEALIRFQVDTGTPVEDGGGLGWFVDDVTVWSLEI